MAIHESLTRLFGHLAGGAWLIVLEHTEASVFVYMPCHIPHAMPPGWFVG